MVVFHVRAWGLDSLDLHLCEYRVHARVSMSRACTVPSVEEPKLWKSCAIFVILLSFSKSYLTESLCSCDCISQSLCLIMSSFILQSGSSVNTQEPIRLWILKCPVITLFLIVKFAELTNKLFFHMRENRNHSSIDRTVVHLTSAPFDRSMVIVVRDTCNSCPVGLFTFKADELKMVHSSRF